MITVLLLVVVFLGYFCYTDYIDNVKKKEYNEWLKREWADKDSMS
jgi:hypothetical protein